MIRFILWLIFSINGWDIKGQLPKDIKKCVMLASPHTSNYDLVYALVGLKKLKVKVRFTIKKEWLKFPFGIFMRPLGAIGIDRGPKTKDRKSMVDAMAELFQDRDELTVLVTPEGTRKRVEKWKSGFYYVALKAKVPIALGYLDYKNKIAGIGPVIYPCGDFEKDLRTIQEFYVTIQPKHPEKFAVPWKD
jgi:1-acyl-sn-glycerol-3-phosphate acyltransferase